MKENEKFRAVFLLFSGRSKGRIGGSENASPPKPPKTPERYIIAESSKNLCVRPFLMTRTLTVEVIVNRTL